MTEFDFMKFSSESDFFFSEKRKTDSEEKKMILYLVCTEKVVILQTLNLCVSVPFVYPMTH